MPYYIYKVFKDPFLRLEKIEQHDAFAQASARVKVLRQDLAQECAVKMVFADHELGAEDLLSQVRGPAPALGDD